MAEKDIKKARRIILQAYYTKKNYFYFLNVKSEGSKYSLFLIVVRSSFRQTYQVKGTDIRGVTVKERKAKTSHPDKVSGLCLHPTRKIITRKKPIRNKISSYVILSKNSPVLLKSGAFGPVNSHLLN